MISPEARNSWRELEGRLRPFIARRIRTSTDVDDVIQDVFLRMQRGLPALRDDQRFGPWLYQVARAAIADHQRQSQRHPIAHADQTDDVPAELEEEDASQALVGCVPILVAQLHPIHSEALSLTEFEGLKQKDAADRLGISLSAMKSRVARGRAELRKSLEECCAIGLDARGGVNACERKSEGCLSGGCG